MSTDVQALVNHYAREGYWRHIQTVCLEVLKKRAGDPVLLFWRAFGLVLEGSYSEALRELEPLQGQREVEVAAISASIHAHKQCKIVDEEAVASLKKRLQNEERAATERTLLQAALFYWHIGGPDNVRKAKELVERILKVQPQYSQAQVLQGWLELTGGNLERRDSYGSTGGGKGGGAVTRALSLFENVLSRGGKELEALLGRAKCYELKEDYLKALAEMTQVIVAYPWFLPGLNEKARLLLITGDWDQAMETAQRILTLDPNNIEALRLTLLYLLSHESRTQVAAKRLGDLLDSLDRNEPKNAPLYSATAKPLARLAGRTNTAVLQRTLTLVDRARKLAPQNAAYAAEYAYQQMLLGEVGAALTSCRAAAALDEMNMDAVYGTIRCQLASNQLDEAASQLEFLTEISASIDKSAELLFLSAQLAWLRERNAEKSTSFLEKALESHAKALQGLKLGLEYYTELNPEVLLEGVRMLLQQCGVEPRGVAEPAAPNLVRAVKVLETVERAAPGLLEAQLLLARARYLNAESEGAMRAAQAALRLDQASSDAHVLLAQVYLVQGKVKLAGQELEQAMAYDFSVREAPQFQAVRARVLTATGELDEAVKVLEGALNTPGVRHAGPPSKGPGGRKKVPELTAGERVNIYLLLAEAHMKLNHTPEATKVIQDALNEFSGTAEEVRVMIANAELSLLRNDVEGALRMLREIPPDSPHFSKVKVAMAEIFLKHLHDRNAYADCYLELAERSPDAQTFVMLGDAFLRIQEPGRAVGAFEAALKKDPRNPVLASRIGRALVSTHDYNKAIDHYEAAVRGGRSDGGDQQGPQRLAMQQDLAELYYKLKRYEEAERVLEDFLAKVGDAGNGNDSSSVSVEVRSLVLLASVQKGLGKKTEAGEALVRARSLQSSLLAKIRLEQPDIVKAQKQVAAEVCFELAKENEGAKALEKAVALYVEALKHADTHVPSMLALARLYLNRGETEACQSQCVSLLRVEPNNEEASTMLAELMCQREQYDSAIYQFQQSLERKPSHYAALAQLIQLLRRAGRLSELPHYIRLAEKASSRAHLDPGLNYCKGLLARHSNNPHEALKCLNQARRDGEWGTRALYAMVEIYLNPENEALWEEAPADSEDRASAPADNAEAVKAAQKLLAEVPVPARHLRHTVLECYATMATKNKHDVEAALTRLHEVVKEDTESVPGILAMATGLMLQKQSAKVRNHLKRVAKMTYVPEDGDDFEKCWLMLADIYIKNGKHDQAQELCKKALKYNKACGRAWEYLGLIMEKEQNYKEASENYENAWRYENEASPSIGYRLAFNYLKSKRSVEAIGVCHKVIKAYPNYPKIRKDILDKARSNLRP